MCFRSCIYISTWFFLFKYHLELPSLPDCVFYQILTSLLENKLLGSNFYFWFRIFLRSWANILVLVALSIVPRRWLWIWGMKWSLLSSMIASLIFYEHLPIVFEAFVLFFVLLYLVPKEGFWWWISRLLRLSWKNFYLIFQVFFSRSIVKTDKRSHILRRHNHRRYLSLRSWSFYSESLIVESRLCLNMG